MKTEFNGEAKKSGNAALLLCLGLPALKGRIDKAYDTTVLNK